MEAEFDANTMISGFPLVKIKAALTHIGIMDDRDDVKNVADALHCNAPQATRVLEELERLGYVTKTAKRRHWDKTPRGARLAYGWQPPRKLEPAILREEEKGITEVFDSVPCSIERPASGDDSMFEEADLEVGMTVMYESSRLIRFEVMQPDDYDDRSASGSTEVTLLVGIDEAKTIAGGLNKAIAKAEKELARRATKKAVQAKRAAVAKAKPKGNARAVAANSKRLVCKGAPLPQSDVGASPTKIRSAAPSSKGATQERDPSRGKAAAGMARAATLPTRSAAEIRADRRRDVLAATLRELGGSEEKARRTRQETRSRKPIARRS